MSGRLLNGRYLEKVFSIVVTHHLEQSPDSHSSHTLQSAHAIELLGCQPTQCLSVLLSGVGKGLQCFPQALTVVFALNSQAGSTRRSPGTFGEQRYSNTGCNRLAGCLRDENWCPRRGSAPGLNCDLSGRLKVGASEQLC